MRLARAKVSESGYNEKAIVLFGLVALAGTAAHADQQDTVKRCARIPARISFHARTPGPPPFCAMHAVLPLCVWSKWDSFLAAKAVRAWSSPAPATDGQDHHFIGTGGAGWDLQMGAEATDFVFVLNNRDAVRALSRGGNVMLGGDVSAAAGPVGRDVEANVTPKAAIYTYRNPGKQPLASTSISLEGAVIATEKGKNERYYGRSVTASQILSGKAAAPPGSAALRNAAGR